jgi:hypothetical protein
LTLHRNIVVRGIALAILVGACGGSAKTVPDVTGMNPQEAIDAIHAAGIDHTKSHGGIGAEEGAGFVVCRTGPAAGHEASGSVNIYSSRSCKAQTDRAKADVAAREGAAKKPRLHVSSASFCEQIPITDGNLLEQATQGTLVKFVVAVKNTGDKDLKGGTIAPKRHYADGKDVFSIGDTMVDVDVPADRKVHRFVHAYKVGPGHTVTECSVTVSGDGASVERAIRVAN